MVHENWTLEKMGVHFRRTPAFIKKELQRLNLIANPEDEPEYVAYKSPQMVGGVAVGDNVIKKKGAVIMTPQASQRGDTIREEGTNTLPDRSKHLAKAHDENKREHT